MLSLNEKYFLQIVETYFIRAKARDAKSPAQGGAFHLIRRDSVLTSHQFSDDQK